MNKSFYCVDRCIEISEMKTLMKSFYEKLFLYYYLWDWERYEFRVLYFLIIVYSNGGIYGNFNIQCFVEG